MQDDNSISLDQLIVNSKDLFDGYLIQHKIITNQSNKINFRVSFLKSNAMNLIDINRFSKLLADSIIDFCFPKSRIDAAKADKDSRKIMQLANQARNLFVDSKKSGEAGEVLLYLLCESILEAPQIISKMDYKTSDEMHVHGSDGIHIKETESGGIALYWGESKIYKNRTSAVTQCLDSIKPFLVPLGTGKTSRDLHLIQNNLDKHEKELKDKLVRYFIQENPEWNEIEIRAACLVGFNYEEYPKFKTPENLAENSSIIEMIEDWQENLAEKVASDIIANFHIDFFMIPFTDIDEFRDNFMENVKNGY